MNQDQALTQLSHIFGTPYNLIPPSKIASQLPSPEKVIIHLPKLKDFGYANLVGGRWCLTAKGLKRAQMLQNGELKKNATTEWLEKNFRTVYPKTVAYLNRKMPRSRMLGKIEDHAQRFFIRIMAKDSFKKVLPDKPPSQSMINLWALRSSYSEIRDEAQNPVCRVFHAALIPKEVLSVNHGEDSPRCPQAFQEEDYACPPEEVKVFHDTQKILTRAGFDDLDVQAFFQHVFYELPVSRVAKNMGLTSMQVQAKIERMKRSIKKSLKEEP